MDEVKQWQERSEEKATQKKNAQILLARPYSMHPSDWYLSVVMAFIPDNTLHPYVTWMHNSSFPENPDYFFEGHYFKDKQEAFEDWKSR